MRNLTKHLGAIKILVVFVALAFFIAWKLNLYPDQAQIFSIIFKLLGTAFMGLFIVEPARKFIICQRCYKQLKTAVRLLEKLLYTDKVNFDHLKRYYDCCQLNIRKIMEFASVESSLEPEIKLLHFDRFINSLNTHNFQEKSKTPEYRKLLAVLKEINC